ncbi:chemotaxis protein CheB [Luteolibacter yonseiensis]|uniref:chemotaxis protein CheB n=1 Tax=Luteolibacter yonseiensis TaxID=1144680 RepID=UPI001F3C6984
MKEPVRIPVIVIGASAGAVEALSHILPALPADFPYAVLIVVHIPSDPRSHLASLFAGRCNLRVKEAEDKEPLSPGTIYFAPSDYHLLAESDYRLSLSSDEPVRYSRPSIDVLFESAADAFGDDLTGLILTGSNSDGAKGLRAICDAGGIALVQTPDTADAHEMPLAALKACPGARSLSLSEIPAALNSLHSR